MVACFLDGLVKLYGLLGDVLGWVYVYIDTPPKTNMDTQNDGF